MFDLIEYFGGDPDFAKRSKIVDSQANGALAMNAYMKLVDPPIIPTLCSRNSLCKIIQGSHQRQDHSARNNSMDK